MIVRSNLNLYSVSRPKPDEIPNCRTGRVGQHFLLVIQH
jgi:hypothetical protein